jgi:hypothetical protein
MRGDDTYPPELMETMRLAFHKTCKALQLSDVDDAFTDIVATSRSRPTLQPSTGRTVSVAMAGYQ